MLGCLEGKSDGCVKVVGEEVYLAESWAKLMAKTVGGISSWIITGICKKVLRMSSMLKSKLPRTLPSKLPSL